MQAAYDRASLVGDAELLRTSEILLIGGGVLLLAAIVIGFEYIVNFFSKRSSQLGTNAVILSVAVVPFLSDPNSYYESLPEPRKPRYARRQRMESTERTVKKIKRIMKLR